MRRALLGAVAALAILATAAPGAAQQEAEAGAPAATPTDTPAEPAAEETAAPDASSDAGAAPPESAAAAPSEPQPVAAGPAAPVPAPSSDVAVTPGFGEAAPALGLQAPPPAAAPMAGHDAALAAPEAGLIGQTVVDVNGQAIGHVVEVVQATAGGAGRVVIALTDVAGAQRVAVSRSHLEVVASGGFVRLGGVAAADLAALAAGQ